MPRMSKQERQEKWRNDLDILLIKQSKEYLEVDDIRGAFITYYRNSRNIEQIGRIKNILEQAGIEVSDSDCSFVYSANSLFVRPPKDITSVYFDTEDGMRNGDVTSVVASRLQDYYFKDRAALRLVEIPPYIIVIGRGCFLGCKSLNNVKFKGDISIIDISAFRGCESLKLIDIPDTCIFVLSLAFAGCSNLLSIKMPSSLNIVGYGAFADCTKLNSIDLHNVLAIFDGAFTNCVSLTLIELPNSLTKLGPGAFLGCTNLKKIIKHGRKLSTLLKREYPNIEIEVV